MWNKTNDTVQHIRNTINNTTYVNPLVIEGSDNNKSRNLENDTPKPGGSNAVEMKKTNLMQ